MSPHRSLRLASAPWASSASTASGCSWWEAAKCNAVRPSPLAMPGSASARSSSPYGRDGPDQQWGGTGKVQRRVAVLVPPVGVAAGIKQRLHRFGRADRGRAVHRRAAVAVGHVGVGALGQQGPYFARIARRLTGKLAKARVVGGFGMSEDRAEHEHGDARNDRQG